MTELRSYLARVLWTLVIPQGYTLFIAGTFAVASHRYGSPFPPEAWGFVVGAVLAFVGLAVLSARHLHSGMAEMRRGVRAVLNVVPLGSVLLGAAAVYAIPWPLIGFPVAGLVAAGGYALLLSAFLAAVA